MICLACGTEMVERRVDRVAIDECRSCGAIWFDAGELNQYLPETAAGEHAVSGPSREAVEEPDAGAKETGLCPRCGEPVGNSRWRQVTVTRCCSCRGLFLSAEALASLAGADLDQERNTPAKAVYETLFHTLGELAMAVFDWS